MGFNHRTAGLVFMLAVVLCGACAGLSTIDEAVKKQNAAFYYCEQKDFLKAKSSCEEALALWKTVKGSKIRSIPEWSVDNNISRCEKLLEMLPTSEARERTTVVPFRFVRNRIIVDGVLNEKEHVVLLVDTGASISLVTPEVAKLLDIGTQKDSRTSRINLIGGKSIEAPIVSLSEVKVGNAVVRNLLVGVSQFSPEGPFVGGILGSDFLRFFDVTIDQQNSLLKLEAKNETPGLNPK